MGLYFEEIELGMTAETARRTITETDIVMYSGLSGDQNPLHTDAIFARDTPYGERVAHGPLVLGIAMGLINRTGITDGTGLGILGLEDWRFVGSVKIGDTIKVRTTVTETRRTSKPGRAILKRGVEVLNETDVVVQKGVLVTMVRTRDGA